jgi:hypothetical protein
MPGRFIVRSSDPASSKQIPQGEVSYCETAAKAIVHANDLIAEGHRHVRIRDLKCRYHEPRNFDQLLADANN